MPHIIIRLLVLVIGAILLIPTMALMMWGIQFRVEQTTATQKILLSRISDNTPISGFYGPGTWWAWLITLGMSHGHTGMALLKTGELPSDWDYDLVAASIYAVVAGIDLMHKSRTIAQLGDKAGESVLLPALVCAERVVAIGTGSSLFTLATAFVFGRLSRLRMIGVAAIPLIFALICSGFTLHAHQAISHTTPVIWCSLHDGSTPWKRLDSPFTLVDLPAMAGTAIPYLAGLYVSQEYWAMAGRWSFMVPIVVFVGRVVEHRNHRKDRSFRRALLRRDVNYTLESIGLAFLIPVAIFLPFPIISITIVASIRAVEWVVYWVVFWWPVYILAVFPQMGYFPLTGTSVLEMDQIAALGILVMAAIRTLRNVAWFKGADPLPAVSVQVQVGARKLWEWLLDVLGVMYLPSSAY